MTHLTAREQLLRLLAVTWSPHGVDLPASISWPAVIRLAHKERVAPLLQTAVRRAGIPVPAAEQQTLHRIYYQTAAMEAYRLQILERILAALSAVPVPVLLLKGPALSETLYRNLGARAVGDLDLVVPAEQVSACRRVLEDLDYVPTEVEVTPGAHLAYRNEQAYTTAAPGGGYVEIHWHLLDIPHYLRKIPVQWFWQHSQPVEIGGHSPRILDPQANMLYLPAHLALHHRFHGLCWFVDLALFIHQHHAGLDWAEIAATARRFDLLLALRETLDRLADYWPALPLDGPRRQLRALQPSAQEQRLFRLLTAEPRSPLLDFCTDVICLPTQADRLRFIWANVFPQGVYMRERYQVDRTWRLPFYYLYRLGDGLFKLARTLPQIGRLVR